MSDERDDDAANEHGEHDEHGEGGEPGERSADAHERAEAEALAAALDGQPHAHEPPEDALATALLMRHGGPRGALSQERSEAILGELLRTTPAADEGAARAKTAVPAARSGKVVRLLPWAAALSAAAAVLLLMTRASDAPRASETVASAPLPETSAVAPAPAATAPLATVGLLSAQSAWLRAGLERERGAAAAPSAEERAAAARFEQELRAYRADMFRALQAQYPGKLGQRAPATLDEGARAELERARTAIARGSQ